jgi:hypothetical protein
MPRFRASATNASGESVPWLRLKNEWQLRYMVFLCPARRTTKIPKKLVFISKKIRNKTGRKSGCFSFPLKRKIPPEAGLSFLPEASISNGSGRL